MSRVVLVLTTVPVGVLGETIANAVVAERLAACVNVSAPMTSFYRWKGRIERETECQLVIKTTEDCVAALQQRIAELHTYALPEFLVLTADTGSGAYLDWIASETTT
jgi:periplasmic divalent cation tolerance protein